MILFFSDIGICYENKDINSSDNFLFDDIEIPLPDSGT